MKYCGERKKCKMVMYCRVTRNPKEEKSQFNKLLEKRN